MKKSFILAMCLCTVFGFSITQANAAAFGFYGSVGGGSGDFNYTDDYDPKFDVDTTHSGVGFVFDTNVAQDRLFNYQLNLGYDSFTLKDDFGDELDLGGLMISNTFGFGLVRAPGIRVWLGPEIRLAWASGSNFGSDYDVFGLGFGPALGMNFNLPGPLTLGLKAGYQFMNYAGEASDAYGWWSDIDIKEKMIYLNFSLLFRSPGDEY